MLQINSPVRRGSTRPKKNQCQDGFSLVEVIIAVALLGLAIYAVSDFSEKLSSYKNYIKFLDQKEQIRTGLKSVLSCQQSFGSIASNQSGRIETCPSAPIVLKDASGNTLGTQPSHPGFRDGYRFQATCISEAVAVGGGVVDDKAVGIQVDAQIVDSQGVPKRHPLTSLPLNFSHPSLQGIMGTQTSTPLCPDLFLITPRAFERTVNIVTEASKPDVAAALVVAQQTTSPHGTLQQSCRDVSGGDGVWAWGPAPNYYAGVERLARFDRFCEAFCTHDEGLNYSVGLWQYCGGPGVVPIHGTPVSAIEPDLITCLCIR